MVAMTSGKWVHEQKFFVRRNQVGRTPLFEHYLRTGRRLDVETQASGEIEQKFNPYHDPRNGQFTFAPGHPHSPGGVIISDLQGTSANRRGEGRKTHRQTVTEPDRPYLSARHNEVRRNAARYPAERGTIERWSRTGDKRKFQAQWVHGHREAITAAAKAHDIPPALLGSIAYTEVDGDGVTDDIAHMIRSESGRHIPVGGMPGKLFNPRADHTSFGPLNIQERRAAQILGYGDISTMSETARRTLVPTTKDPTAAIFMAAQHLSDLRNIEFRGVSAKDLTKDQMLIIATRYNQGPEKSLVEIKRPKSLSHGYDYLAAWSHVLKLIK